MLSLCSIWFSDRLHTHMVHSESLQFNAIHPVACKGLGLRGCNPTASLLRLSCFAIRVWGVVTASNRERRAVAKGPRHLGSICGVEEGPLMVATPALLLQLILLLLLLLLLLLRRVYVSYCKVLTPSHKPYISSTYPLHIPRITPIPL